MNKRRKHLCIINTPTSGLHQPTNRAIKGLSSCISIDRLPPHQLWSSLPRSGVELGRRDEKSWDSETALAPHNFTYMQPFCISNWGHWFQCSSSWDSHSRMNMHDQGPSWGRRGASDQLWPFLSAELKFGLISFVGSTKLVPPHSWRTS